MRLLLLAVLLCSGCARPPLQTSGDPLAVAHAMSQQQASAMIGREYIVTAPVLVCRAPSDVYDFRYMGPVPKLAPLKPVINPECAELGAGRFQVVDAAMLRDDGRTVLHIVGAGIDGYIPYESYLPKGYKEVGAYFGTQR
ncbi:MAG TPA: hypothetical protein VG651_13235 [Stellaceae bacterium]|nr:hypothetical protein [Stellaceae bacterium]